LLSNGSAWNLASITATATSAVQAPDGTQTSFVIAEQAANAQHLIGYSYNGPTVVVNNLYCMSGYFQAGTSTSIQFTSYGEPVNIAFTLSGAGSATAPTSTAVATGIQPVGNGWYRCFVVWKKSNTSGGFYVANSNGFGTYLGSTSTTYYAWGMQIEYGVLTPGPYTRTVSAISPIPYSIAGYRVHKYTSTGTSSFTPACTGTVEVLVVGGGGAGGNNYANGGTPGGGGGAGGVIYQQTYAVTSGQTYTVVVGAGGTGSTVTNTYYNNNGGYSQFGPLVALGGGVGGVDDSATSPYGVNVPQRRTANPGGSGGGGSAQRPINAPGVFGQGNYGGVGANGSGGAGGGGGAGGRGGEMSDSSTQYSGEGGAGVPINITGDTVIYGAGGGGGATNTNAIPAGTNGSYNVGGSGASQTATVGTYAGSGIANTGSGGGGTAANNNVVQYPGNGGSGIVVVRYKYD